MSNTNKFKNSMGAHLLKQLFFELADTDRDRVLYTLKGEDHNGYPSLRRLYLEMGDETEFQFASTYFDGWPHWKKLNQCTWFSDHMKELREELSIKNMANHLSMVKSQAEKGNFSATKYLINGEWRPRGSVGRPTKEKIKQEAEKLFMSQADINEDLDRLREHLANG